MAEFIRVFEVLFPVIFILALGFIGKKTNLLDEAFINKGSELVFKVFMPINMLMNIYKSTGLEVVKPSLVVYTFLIALFISGFFYIYYKKKGYDKEKIAVILQSLARSNIVLYGLSIANNYYPKDQVGIIAIYIGIISALTNALGILVHELLDLRKDYINFGKIVLSLLKNTIFLAAIFGIFIKAINLSIYPPLGKALDNLASVATPLGLLCVGASIKLSQELEEKRAVESFLIYKAFIIPIISLVIFYFLGTRGPEMFFIIIYFASPVAVSAHAMAASYTQKGDFCAKLIVYSTILNSITVFFAIYFLSRMGVI